MTMPLPEPVQHVLYTLKSNGFKGYIVGGSVRGLIMRRPVEDWDFTTDAPPEKILELFPDSFYDNAFGTVGIKIYEDNDRIEENKEERTVKEIYEITTFRSEKGYTDKRHPDTIVWGKTIEEDLSRRDFTINAMAYDGKTLVDPYKGLDDIERGIIQTVRSPKDRFSEDALRLIRAIRIATQLEFQISPETFAAIQEQANTITNISYERIRDELFKILASKHPSDGILLLKNSGVLAVILPELEASFDTPQKSPKRHHLYDVGTHSLLALKFCPSNDPIVRLATLLHDIGKPATFKKDDNGVITFYNHEVVGTRIARSIASRFRLSKKQTETILTLVRWHQFSVDERQTDSAIRRIIRRVGKERMDDMLALRTGDRLGGGALETSWRLELFKKRIIDVQKQPFSVRDLMVNGHDVMEIFDCRSGPVIGETLNALFSEVEEGKIPNKREELLKKIREMRLAK